MLGAIAARDAEIEFNDDRRKVFHRLAARYLEEAHDFGFPAGRRAEGLNQLGVSLHESEQYAASLPILRDALEQNPHRASELHRMLASSYSRQSPPQFDKALMHLQEQLADRTLPPRVRQTALLERFAILFGQDRLDECRRTLDEVPDDSSLRSEKAFAIGRLLMREGDVLLGNPQATPDVAAAQADKKYEAAVKAFQLAEGADTSTNQTTPKAQYMLGRAYRKLKQYRAAAKQFDRIARLRSGTPEGLAARLELAEVQQLQGEDEQAIATFGEVLAAVKDPAAFYNVWLPLGELRDRAYQAFVRYREAGDYQSAVALSEMFTPLFPRDRTVEIQAETLRHWGRSLLMQSERLAADAAESVAVEGRAKLRAAGRQFDLLARLRRTSRTYGDQLWSSAEAYFEGHAYGRAVEMLTQFLDNVARRRRPPALVALGEAHLAIGDVDRALKPLTECIEAYPTHPDSYRARLVASQVYLEMDQDLGKSMEHLPQAKQLLEDNLHNEALTPRSYEWRRSLFLLGDVLFRKGMLLEVQCQKLLREGAPVKDVREGVALLEQSSEAFQQSAARLTEAAQRYPEDPQTVSAQYTAAEAHRHAAAHAGRRMELSEIEATRLALKQQLQNELQTALGEYEQLIESLNARSDRTDLTQTELGILRNCYFAKADSLFEQGEYELAATAYGSAANRFHNRPESLEALVQIARCHRELGRTDLARGAIERALVTLEQIPPEMDLTETTRYDRTAWSDLLSWLISLYAGGEGKV